MRDETTFPPWNGAFQHANAMFHVGKSTIDVDGEGLISDQSIAPETRLTHLTIPFPNESNPWPYSTGPGMKINHAELPNAYLYKIPATEPDHSIIYVKSLKKIQPGEEISINYNDSSKLGYGKAEAWYA